MELNFKPYVKNGRPCYQTFLKICPLTTKLKEKIKRKKKKKRRRRGGSNKCTKLNARANEGTLTKNKKDPYVAVFYLEPIKLTRIFGKNIMTIHLKSDGWYRIQCDSNFL